MYFGKKASSVLWVWCVFKDIEVTKWKNFYKILTKENIEVGKLCEGLSISFCFQDVVVIWNIASIFLLFHPEQRDTQNKQLCEGGVKKVM